jgi:predicted nuclease with TOPRIM domain
MAEIVDLKAEQKNLENENMNLKMDLEKEKEKIKGLEQKNVDLDSAIRNLQDRLGKIETLLQWFSRLQARWIHGKC